jgi:hypothetical protein
MQPKPHTTRKASPAIKVYCLPEERQLIQSNAKSAGMSLSAFLLALGQGYQVKGVVDYQQVRELARINGDLGRLEGLLQSWLTNEQCSAEVDEATLRAVLAKIEATQDKLVDVMTSVVMPRAHP